MGSITIRTLTQPAMINIPKISNLQFFNESSLEIPKIIAETQARLNEKINSEGYEQFCRNKYRKPVFDLYAMFNPFNEANKAFYPFIPYLKKHLKKGDIILDVWSRTGWSTALLSGLFPEQNIISIWEGDTDVLGYNGFSYWFSNKDKPSNIEIYFCNLKESLPFEDQSISFVFGFDVLHRQLKSNLIAEILRVTKPNGIILFPHVHLSNNEPSPYFARGGDLIHGKEYASFFNQLTPLGKKGYVFSEPDLYRKSYDSQFNVKANPNTTDYNGLVVICHNELKLEDEIAQYDYFDFFALSEATLLVNPLLEIDLDNRIQLRTSNIGNEIIVLLENHPIYNKELQKTISYQLTNKELILMYWARKKRSCAFIQEQLQIDAHTFKSYLTKLQKLDIVQISTLHSRHVRLQHYYGYQEFNNDVAHLHLQSLWKKAVANHHKNTYLLDRNDNTFYTYAEFNEIVECITSTLIQKGVLKGDKIILEADIHFEAMGLFWACMNLGIILIPINSTLPTIVFETLVAEYQPKIVFLNDTESRHIQDFAQTIYFDSDIESNTKAYFSDWLLEMQNTINLPPLTESDLAVILHTSGSSGMPKGVLLTHGQLFQSATNMVKSYLLRDKDSYLSIGHLDSMSGLRNACLVTASTGASCVMPTENERNNLSLLLEAIDESNITFLVASPSLLNQFLSKKEVKNRLAKVKTVLSTGSNLSSHLKEHFLKKTNKIIFNYYGLTETTGFCIGETLDSHEISGNTIGKAIDCIAQIVDTNDLEVPVETIGELRIYSYGNSSGYYKDDTVFNGIQKWFYTGDLAKRNASGIIELMGRKKDYIKNARSEIVYFQEIEDTLIPLDFIIDTGILCYFENETENLALFVEIDESNLIEENPIQVIKKELITKIGFGKVPTLIKIINKIPRTSHGKLNKLELEKHL